MQQIDLGEITSGFILLTGVKLVRMKPHQGRSRSLQALELQFQTNRNLTPIKKTSTKVLLNGGVVS